MRFFSTLTLLFVYVILFAQNTTKQINISFDIDDFILTDCSGYLNLSSDKYIYHYGDNTSLPALPLIEKKVLIAPNDNYSNFTFSYSEELIRNNTVLQNNPIMSPYTYVQEMIHIPYFRLLDSYQSPIVEYKGTQIIDGYSTLIFLVSPFRYDNETHNLYFNKHIRIDITLNRNHNRTSNTRKHNMRDIVLGMIENPEDSLLYDLSPISLRDTTNQHAYKYIIVTRDSLKSSFQKLADWKTKKGCRAKVLTIEEINQQYSDTTLQLRIKHALYDYYSADNSQLTYVLLGGNANIVPPQYIHLEKRIVTPPYGVEITELLYHNAPSDLYYACYDGTFNWDGNDNGEYAEIDDGINICANVYLTRIPAENVHNANVLVNRFINYEKGSGFFENNPKLLLGGTQLADSLDTVKFYVNGIPRSDAEYYGGIFIPNRYKKYWNGSITRFFDTATDFDNGANYDFTSTNLQAQLDSGYTFVNIMTHGYINLINMENLFDFFTNQNAQAVCNIGNTIFTTSACWTNGFDKQEPCLAVSLMNNENSGIIAYLGCSREGWFDKNNLNLGASDAFNAWFYRFMFANTHLLPRYGLDWSSVYKRYGYLVTKVKYYRCSTFDKYRPDQWLNLAINPLGDPEMPIYISKPKQLSDVSITFLNDTLSVYCGTDSCNICVMSTADKGETIYYTLENISAGTFNIGDIMCDICITHHDYMPYCLTVKQDTVFIQNEQLTTDITISAQKVRIGSNVTTVKPFGNVDIDKGETIINASGDVVIPNGFNVNSGAEFIITNGQ